VPIVYSQGAILTLSLGLLACAHSAKDAGVGEELPAHRREHCDSCNVAIAPGVDLNLGEQCVLGKYRRRCAKHDACIIDCLANRRDEVTMPDRASARVGGGCLHVCFAYTGIKYTLPAGIRACDSLFEMEAVGGLLPNTQMQPTGRSGPELPAELAFLVAKLRKR
jgi:hypothetical protein